MKLPTSPALIVVLISLFITDLMHPMIHFGCDIEFHQPSLFAEALAGACVRPRQLAQNLLAAHKGACPVARGHSLPVISPNDEQHALRSRDRLGSKRHRPVQQNPRQLPQARHPGVACTPPKPVPRLASSAGSAGQAGGDNAYVRVRDGCGAATRGRPGSYIGS